MVEEILPLSRKKCSNGGAIARLFDAVQVENLLIRCAPGINQRFPKFKKTWI